MKITNKKVSSMLDPQRAAFRLIAILYERGKINDETWKNVKDLERQENSDSTSLNKKAY